MKAAIRIDERLKITNKVSGLVVIERIRQMHEEGWSPEHDDKHTNDELVRAAICYAASKGPHEMAEEDASFLLIWPWDLHWWKPTTRKRNLVKAAALILAEIERLERLEESDE